MRILMRKSILGNILLYLTNMLKEGEKNIIIFWVQLEIILTD